MINFEIETKDIRVLFDLLGNPKTFSTGDSIGLPGNAKLIYRGMQEKRAIDFPTIIQFTIEHLDQVAVGLVAAWLYDKLKNRPIRLRFNKEKFDFSKKAVEAMLRQHYKNTR